MKPKASIFRFGLRTLLFLILMVCPLLAWIGYQHKEWGREQAALENGQMLVVRNGDFRNSFFS